VSATEETARELAARERAADRVRRQRASLRPLGWAMIVAVVASAAGAHPAPGLHDRGLGVTLALVVFAATVAVAIRPWFVTRETAVQAAVLGAMGASGVALVALQPRGATVLAGAAAVWMGVARLPVVAGVALAACVTGALDVAAGLAGSSAAAIVAATLLCALLGFVAYFLKQARASQDRTELLLAQLEDARERELESAAFAERGRIAGELHDVLAHALSGAAIQLQGVRLLVEREQASAQARAAVERASELVKEGLASARQAVGALRGEELPGVAQLESLVESFRTDLNVDVTLRIEGPVRQLPVDAGLALYRGAQEALTNVARYAPGAPADVLLRYEDGRTMLCVENRLAARVGGGLEGVGGGRGLAGMRERVERAGGSMRAGPTGSGWRVELEVPA
jgi:signal transduction histidine kinase